VNVLHVGGVQQVLLEVRVARSTGRWPNASASTSTPCPRRQFWREPLNSLTTVSELSRVFTGVTRPLRAPPSPRPSAPPSWPWGLDRGRDPVDRLFRPPEDPEPGTVLAEPNLVTTSGQQASFLAGGQFPYPLTTGTGASATTSINWQNFGVQLEFTPTVLNDGKIAVKVQPTVSELDFTLGSSPGVLPCRA